MPGVMRLVTVVDVADDGSDPDRLSVSATHAAELGDGSRVPLLDRGWSESGERGPDARPDVWARKSAEDIEYTARFVVGPDEPFDDRTQADMERDYWAFLAEILAARGVSADARELRALPHDVELSEALRARLARGTASP